MKKTLAALLAIGLSWGARASTSAQIPVSSRNLLWYRAPAANWNEALPIGNGRLGAMVFGGVVDERLQLNEETVWAGQKLDRVNPQAAASIPEIRRLLFAGKPVDAEALADKTIISVPRRMPPYQTLGDVKLRFQLDGEPSDYQRELDLDEAVAGVRFRVGGTTFRREVLATAVDQVIAMRLTSDRPGAISFTASMSRERDATSRAEGNQAIVLEGQALPASARHADEPKAGVHFAAIARVVTEGGHAQADGASLTVTGATKATVLIAAATTMKERDPARAARAVLDAAAGRDYDNELRPAHVADYQRFAKRARLSLDAPTPELPTDERLARVKAGATDLALEALYFAFGRYLLISSSRPGTLPATLQGIWNDSVTPSWDSKYTVNINTEMNYWPAEVTNLSELHGPLFDLVDTSREDGRHVAKTMYGSRGFVIHHNTDAWGHAGPIDGVRSGIWPAGGAWLALHFWDHYDFTRDREFLRTRAYPVLKEASEFLLDYMVTDSQGRLVTGPSISPENQYKLPDGTSAALTMGPYMDTEIAHALFGRAIQASEILGVDADFRNQLATARQRLPLLKIGKYGQLQEWLEDYDERDPGHRHISHLFALHPGNQITIRGTPDLARAARVTLERRLAAGGGGTGWSRAWIVNFWARLEDGDRAHENFVALLANSTQPNMFDSHPPFQIDGNFGGTAGMVEMLLQSHAGEIAILPALPSAWPSGSVTGLRARGAVGVDITWHAGQVRQVRLRPDVDGEQVIRPPKGLQVAIISGPGGIIFRGPAAPDGTARVALRGGSTYSVVFAPTQSR
ncbi:MAG TPA: glycoside hydrolase family 95 protein [Vicinamibacterales bacterium]|nr:glycoside hydrolase family 95 protein [Vicinamibacterales bacterium]